MSDSYSSKDNKILDNYSSKKLFKVSRSSLGLFIQLTQKEVTKNGNQVITYSNLINSAIEINDAIRLRDYLIKAYPISEVTTNGND